MAMRSTRREFLADVGRGVLIAGVGMHTAAELGLAAREDGEGRLEFGGMEPLVRLMQETPPGKLNATLIGKMKEGVSLRELVAAGALANARSFGGEDYVGFHTMMALAPAWKMSALMAGPERALPVLKVLYRNTSRIQESGNHKSEVLKPVSGSSESADGRALREAVRRKDVDGAEKVFAGIAKGDARRMLNELLVAVHDNTEVHRVVLPYRAWDLLDVVGQEHAHTLLRQSVRYCVKAENPSRGDEWNGARTVLPEVMEKYKLMDKAAGTKAAEDGWVDQLSRTIFNATPREAAEAAAAALAEGFAPDAVGEAISLAANQLLLRDEGRPVKWESPGKPVGSVHGDSIGVHACDSANAWRHLSKAGDARNVFACLILGAYQVAMDRGPRDGEFKKWEPLPIQYHLNQVKETDAQKLLGAADEAIRGNLQGRACAIAAKYGQLGHAPKDLFELLLKYAVSEDGSLHAEKYYQTVREEFAGTREKFKWRQMIALARVTASEYGRPAVGVAEARGMLN